jgi:hypothetical protein
VFGLESVGRLDLWSQSTAVSLLLNLHNLNLRLQVVLIMGLGESAVLSGNLDEWKIYAP